MVAGDEAERDWARAAALMQREVAAAEGEARAAQAAQAGAERAVLAAELEAREAEAASRAEWEERLRQALSLPHTRLQ